MTLGPGVSQTVVFNDSTRGDGSHDNVINQWRRIIDEAHPGTSLTAIMWKMDLEDVARRLAHAHHRGVFVEVAYKGGNETRWSNWLANELNRNTRDRSRFVTCNNRGYSSQSNGACISGRQGGSAHNKMLLAERTGNRSHVVLVSSAHPDFNQLVHYNDALVTSGDKYCFDKFYAYSRDVLAKRKDNNNAVRRGHFICQASMMEVWLGPRAASDGGLKSEWKTDTVAQILAGLTPAPNCKQYVLNSKIDAKRKPVMDEMNRLWKGNCHTRLITRVDPPFVGTVKQKIGLNFGSTGAPHVHMKAIVWENMRQPDGYVTGSGNLTGDHRKNDEAIVRGWNPHIVQAYLVWAGELTRRAKRNSPATFGLAA